MVMTGAGNFALPDPHLDINSPKVLPDERVLKAGEHCGRFRTVPALLGAAEARRGTLRSDQEKAGYRPRLADFEVQVFFYWARIAQGEHDAPRSRPIDYLMVYFSHGNFRLTIRPPSGRLLALTSPRCRRTARSAIASPTPNPPVSRCLAS